MIETAVLFSAMAFDRLIGDPVYRLHPVRLMGNLIGMIERILFKMGLSGLFGGFILLVTVPGFCVLGFLAACHLADHWFAGAGTGVCIFFLYSVTGLKDLSDHAAPVLKSLRLSDLTAARKNIQRFVGRDASRLDASGVARAAVESIAENFVDGFLSVVFWFVCGAAFAGVLRWPPAVSAVLCAIIYRAINTLDAMVGHKNDRYEKFGFASAKADDFLNFFPARISIPLIIAAAHVCGFDAKNGLRIAMQDRKKHASPNSGHPESAMAGILNIQLGGPTFYHYGHVEKPWIGENQKPITPDHIEDACRVIFCAAGISLAFAMASIALISTLR